MKGTVLLVDDNESDRELAAIAMEQIGYGDALVSVGSAESAWAYLAREARPVEHQLHPSLVLLDLRMPGMDGHDLLAAVREHRDLRSIPVVVLSASAEPRDVARSYALGASGYMVKPVAFDRLVDLLKKACGFWLEACEPPQGCARVLRG